MSEPPVTHATLDVYLLPQLIPPGALRGRRVVVVDVLRATTTIVTALAQGALQVFPSDAIERARMLATERTPTALLGGERQGMKIAGFDLGNSPREYTAEAIGGREIVLATTNGTCAMFSCHEADDVLIGAFVNRQAIVAALESAPHLAIVCSGTDRMVTAEDALFAGSLIEPLATNGSPRTLNDQAHMARALWESTWQATGDPGSLAVAMGRMHGGRNLVRRDMAEDIEFCAQFDRFGNVPRLNTRHWSIR